MKTTTAETAATTTFTKFKLTQIQAAATNFFHLFIHGQTPPACTCSTCCIFFNFWLHFNFSLTNIFTYTYLYTANFTTKNFLRHYDARVVVAAVSHLFFPQVVYSFIFALLSLLLLFNLLLCYVLLELCFRSRGEQRVIRYCSFVRFESISTTAGNKSTKATK